MIIFEIVVTVLLALSLWANYRLLSRLLFVNNNLDEVLSSIEVFREHLELLNRSEIYMGEPTIEKFIEHSNEVVGDIDSFLSEFSDEEVADG